MNAYRFLGGRPPRERFGGELGFHGGQVAVQQIQGGVNPSRVAVIPCLLCKSQLPCQLLVEKKTY